MRIRTSRLVKATAAALATDPRKLTRELGKVRKHLCKANPRRCKHFDDCLRTKHGLWSVFSFSDTPQGFDFWMRLVHKM